MSKVILITGTSSGFGRTIAEKLHFEGYTVIGTSRNAEKISSDYLTIKLDINDYEASKSEVNQIINKYGKIDILINNAGINITGPIETIKMDDVKRVFDTNFFSQLNLIQTVLPFMRSEKEGLIINITSIAEYLGLQFWVAYCASKGAVHQITRAMALDHAKDGIRINSVCPGEVNTPMLSTGRESPPTKEDLQKLADETIPVARLAEPEEVANVVHFLASEDSSYMTGSMITVDGGFTTR